MGSSCDPPVLTDEEVLHHIVDSVTFDRLLWTPDDNVISLREYLDLDFRVQQVTELLVVYFKVVDSHLSGDSVLAVLYLLS